ncbi:MAG: hypothetical protein KA000_00420 [Candidatus Saccharicenans sp.]|jgi:hypothetical protein|nr:hypothetical protein [Candidatus Saccharicenans sp.]NMC66129.1 hypothetical protein [Acidobacteriota bacterium]
MLASFCPRSGLIAFYQEYKLAQAGAISILFNFGYSLKLSSTGLVKVDK